MTEEIADLVKTLRKSITCPGCVNPALLKQTLRKAADTIERLDLLDCPEPSLKDKYPLVIYFKDKAGALEFTKLVAEAKPNFTWKQL